MLKQDNGEYACIAEDLTRYNLGELKMELQRAMGLNTEADGSVAQGEDTGEVIRMSYSPKPRKRAERKQRGRQIKRGGSPPEREGKQIESPNHLKTDSSLHAQQNQPHSMSRFSGKASRTARGGRMSMKLRHRMSGGYEQDRHGDCISLSHLESRLLRMESAQVDTHRGICNQFCCAEAGQYSKRYFLLHALLVSNDANPLLTAHVAQMIMMAQQ
eukprot:691236-Pelagomonas_calceolata.AAC.3